MFDELVVAIGVNSEKKPYLDVDARRSALEQCCVDLPNVRVETFDGLLVDFARREQSKVVLRGLRAISDYDYEFRIALANRRLAPEIETVFVIATEEFSFLASSVVREIARLGGDYAQFVPPPVVELIRQKLESD